MTGIERKLDALLQISLGPNRYRHRPAGKLVVSTPALDRILGKPWLAVTENPEGVQGLQGLVNNFQIQDATGFQHDVPEIQGLPIFEGNGAGQVILVPFRLDVKLVVPG